MFIIILGPLNGAGIGALIGSGISYIHHKHGAEIKNAFNSAIMNIESSISNRYNNFKNGWNNFWNLKFA